MTLDRLSIVWVTSRWLLRGNAWRRRASLPGGVFTANPDGCGEALKDDLWHLHTRLLTQTLARIHALTNTSAHMDIQANTCAHMQTKFATENHRYTHT